ncbi:fumarylacetoacetate hydrolase family protein [Rhodococcus rhodochrous]|uniref:fumarylacetoacetate hydrolase family protein n=1 Tax=Rhodococcus rhodochrous TaxID=1829 RepID=UPI0002FAB25F|nr:fumarylacetoacetate hydrolase family protein [Rhodococcus rhodochrous]
MRLASVTLAGTDHVVVAVPDQDRVATLADLYAKAGLGEAPATVKTLLKAGADEWAKVRQAYQGIADVPTVSLDEVTWLPPVPDAGKILCAAMNNSLLTRGAHVEAAAPMFFLKPPSAMVGHGDNIEIIPDDYGFTFPELEVGVIIGRKAKNISEDEALDYVAGYTIVNDITSQGLKRGDSIAVDVTRQQADSPGYSEYFAWRRVNGPDDLAVYLTYHTRSKGTDTFGPMGPWLTTADEISNPDALAVRGYADGEVFAEDSTSAYSFTVAKLISWASRYFTLEPGDIILTGTAAKGNEKFPRGHHEIDMSRMTPTIDIEIEGLGKLTNKVTHVTRA